MHERSDRGRGHGRGGGRGGGRGRGRGRGRGGSGRPNEPWDKFQAALDKFCSVANPQQIHSEADARKFLAVVQVQALYPKDLKRVVWQLVSTAAVAELSERLNNTDQALNEAPDGDGQEAAQGTEKAPGLQRVEELMHVAASAADSENAAVIDAAVKDFLVPLLFAVQGVTRDVVAVHDKAVGEVLGEVYKAPYILGILAEHVRQPQCSEKHLLLITAFISRMFYTPKHGCNVPSNRHVKAIIAVATSDSSPLPKQAIFKLNALFAATGTAASAHQKELMASGAAAAVARWPGGRHDNDHVDFRSIQVVPTVNEIKHTSPFLPYTDRSDQFLVWEPQARGMDSLFRLFREDQLMCIRQALEDCDSPHPNGPRPIVFRNVRPEGYDFDRSHSPLFQLGFDVPDRVQKMKSDALLDFWQRSRWLSVGCLLAIRERRGNETQRMLLAEVVQRNPGQLVEECAKGKRATVGVRFFGAEGTQYALSTILARQASDERNREGGKAAKAAGTRHGPRARQVQGQGEGEGDERRAGAGKENGAGAGTEQGAAVATMAAAAAGAASPQAAAAAAATARAAAAAAATARLGIAAENPTPPPPPPPQNGAGPSTGATPQAEAVHTDRGSARRKRNAEHQSVASEAELPLLVDAVQVAHDFGVCKPVLQALQEDRLLAPPFGETLFAAADQQPQTGFIDAPVWQNDAQMAGWLQKRLDTMDPAQQQAFDHALTRKVALIQGPPGCGKTYVAINVVRALLADEAKILIVCYTNHALDQILEAILDSGLPESKALRIGGRSKSEKIEPIMLSNILAAQRTAGAPKSPMQPSERSRNFALMAERSDFKLKLNHSLQKLMSVPWHDLARVPLLALESSIQEEHNLQALLPFGYIEGVEGRLSDAEFECAMQAEEDDDLEHETFGQDDYSMSDQESAEEEEWHTVRRQACDRNSLWRLWLRGALVDDPRVENLLQNYSEDPEDWPVDPWAVKPADRVKLARRWVHDEQQEVVLGVYAVWQALLNTVQEQQKLLDVVQVRDLSQSKILVGCTTSGAAKYRASLAAIPFTGVLVEEAAEIVGPHVIASLPPTAERLIMIGDHKQLRPKVNSYSLQIQSGKGFDLNVSVFERLVQEGIQYQALRCQHRMQPAISKAVRELTYDNLEDADHVHGREALKGVGEAAANSVFFVAHGWPERADADAGVASMDSASRVNIFESLMVVRTLKYMLQQGYGMHEIVILTPYLGQLRLLMTHMREQGIDEMADKRDEDELERQGLELEIFGQADKPKAAVRVSTVDNFQGEEARIIIVSLVRSNAAGKIGFLYEPQRVNVLLSRARDALILVGNPHCLCGRKATLSNVETAIELAGKNPREPLKFTTRTFVYEPAPKRNSDSKSTWEQVLAHVEPMAGFPARCQQHGKEVLLKTPQDFEQHTPDGGCMQACGARLPCGHKCGSRCHARRKQHAMCREMVDCMCKAGEHNMHRMCSATEPPPCTVVVPEVCSNQKHLIERKCKNAKPPPCMGLPTGEKHQLQRKCCEVVPNSCRFCTKELKRRQAVEKQESELARKMQMIKELTLAEEQLAQSAAMERVNDEMRAVAATKPCGVCSDDICELDGIYCPCKEHFVCDECFTQHVKSQSELAEEFVPYAAGEIWCVYKPLLGMAGCTSQHAFTPKEVAQHVPADICNLYLKARDRVREKEQVEEHAKEMQCLEERLRKELADQIAPVRRLIVDTVLTTSCPRCRAAFVDFTGCMALTCSRPGCSCGFCAICLKDCDRDAHAHIARCTYMTVGRGNVFASEDNIKQMQNAWRTAKIKEILLPLGPDLRIKVLGSLTKELEDLGITGIH